MSASDLLARYEASFAEARKRFLAIMCADPSDPANRLCQWLATSGANPHGLFSNRAYASSLSTLEGCVGMFHLIHHAIHDDGDLSFVQTRSMGPYLCFHFRKEADFAKVFHEEMLQQGHSAQVLRGAEITGFLDSVEAFIAAKEQHEADCIASYERFIKE